MNPGLLAGLANPNKPGFTRRVITASSSLYLPPNITELYALLQGAGAGGGGNAVSNVGAGGGGSGGHAFFASKLMASLLSGAYVEAVIGAKGTGGTLGSPGTSGGGTQLLLNGFFSASAGGGQPGGPGDTTPRGGNGGGTTSGLSWGNTPSSGTAFAEIFSSTAITGTTGVTGAGIAGSQGTGGTGAGATSPGGAGSKSPIQYTYSAAQLAALSRLFQYLFGIGISDYTAATGPAVTNGGGGGGGSLFGPGGNGGNNSAGSNAAATAYGAAGGGASGASFAGGDGANGVILLAYR